MPGSVAVHPTLHRGRALPFSTGPRVRASIPPRPVPLLAPLQPKHDLDDDPGVDSVRSPSRRDELPALHCLARGEVECTRPARVLDFDMPCAAVRTDEHLQRDVTAFAGATRGEGIPRWRRMEIGDGKAIGGTRCRPFRAARRHGLRRRRCRGWRSAFDRCRVAARLAERRTRPVQCVLRKRQHGHGIVLGHRSRWRRSGSRQRASHIRWRRTHRSRHDFGFRLVGGCNHGRPQPDFHHARRLVPTHAAVLGHSASASACNTMLAATAAANSRRWSTREYGRSIGSPLR